MTERIVIKVRRDRSGVYMAEWNGQQARGVTPFGLDSSLDAIGAPGPRDLILEQP